jgi:hypothetical protein
VRSMRGRVIPAVVAAEPAVILGLVNGGDRPGIFHRRHELVAGDEVVRRVEQELRLITCGGAFDRAARGYRDNVIVYAVGKMRSS